MQIRVERDQFSGRSTLGRMSIDGEFHCFTLEDVLRPIKIKGMTAIPAGLYEVIVNFSARFKRPLPLLLNVPNFDGVRIHTGNTDADTEGCLLVGRSRRPDFVGESRAAFAALFERIQEAVLREKVFIEIVDVRPGVAPATVGATLPPARRVVGRKATRTRTRTSAGAGRKPR